MRMIEWEELPEIMQTQEVRPYYDLLRKKAMSLYAKRLFDVIVSGILILLLFPVMVLIGVCIHAETTGPVLFRQKRVTQYGKNFYILKFRTMVNEAEKMGTQVTTEQDLRVTNLGRKLRRYRLDELPQLFNVMAGDMTFVGTRPEVPRYVKEYTREMYATLLLPAGITSMASICYKDEAKLLEDSSNADETYIRQILPEKMSYNLAEIKKFHFFRDIWIMIKTIIVVFK